MSSPIISVIVPVYQAETTLRRCLNSILSQTFNDFEVLLVNDGSTDHSGEICDEYAKKDARVRYFEKTHSGVSDTRQMGLDSAVGDYVIHCDSDDWIEPTMLYNLYKTAKETGSELVVCDYIEEGVDFFHHKEFPNGYDSSMDICEQVMSLSYCVWNKLILRSFIVENALKFPPSLCFAEDMDFSLRFLNFHPKTSYVNYPLYHYNRKNEGSLSSNISIECFKSHKMVIDGLQDALNIFLAKKLESNKIDILHQAYERGYWSGDLLRITYPEVHECVLLRIKNDRTLVPLAFALYRGHLIFKLHILLMALFCSVIRKDSHIE